MYAAEYLADSLPFGAEPTPLTDTDNSARRHLIGTETNQTVACLVAGSTHKSGQTGRQSDSNKQATRFCRTPADALLAGAATNNNNDDDNDDDDDNYRAIETQLSIGRDRFGS